MCTASSGESLTSHTVSEARRQTKRAPRPTRAKGAHAHSRSHLVSPAPLPIPELGFCRFGRRPQRVPTHPDSITGAPGGDYSMHDLVIFVPIPMSGFSRDLSPPQLARELRSVAAPARTIRRLSGPETRPTFLAQSVGYWVVALRVSQRKSGAQEERGTRNTEATKETEVNGGREGKQKRSVYPPAPG